MVTKKFKVAAILVLGGMFCASLYAQSYPDKYIGFMGPYHSNHGHMYAGENVPESTSVEDGFKCGEYGIVNCASYSGYPFKDEVQLCCETWKVEKVFGVILCQTEGGTLNNTADTALWTPLNSSYGMIQAAHRFSELSKIYPQIEGIILDDYWRNYPNNMDSSAVRDVKDALLGKYVDKNGVVHHDSTATTPNLKFFVCTYDYNLPTPDAFTLNVVNGLSFWMWNQNSDYSNFSYYINEARSLYPKKDIIGGVYLYNSGETWSSTASINSIVDSSMDLYDRGILRGLFFFSGDWVVMENSKVTRAEWNTLALPHLFDQVYYPYLGKGIGAAYDDSKSALEGVKVSCFTKGRVSHDTFYVTKQKTDSLGAYEFGAWAGNRTTDSTYYWIIGEKEGYRSDTVSGWIKRQTVTAFPDLVLKNIGTEERTSSNAYCAAISFSVKPNPDAGKVTLRYSLYSESYLTIKIYDITGKEIKTVTQGKFGPGTYNAEWDAKYENGKQAKSGIYFCHLDAGAEHIVRKITLVK